MSICTRFKILKCRTWHLIGEITRGLYTEQGALFLSLRRCARVECPQSNGETATGLEMARLRVYRTVGLWVRKARSCQANRRHKLVWMNRPCDKTVRMNRPGNSRCHQCVLAFTLARPRCQTYVNILERGSYQYQISAWRTTHAQPEMNKYSDDTLTKNY